MFYQTSQTIGDIISMALRVYRANVGLVFKKLIIPIIFLAVAGLAIQWCTTSGLRQEVFSHKDIGKAVLFGAIMLASVIILLTGYWIILIRQLAFVRLITNTSSSYDDALTAIWKRAWSILGLQITMLFIFVFACGLIATSIAIPVIFVKNILGLVFILCFSIVFLACIILAVPFWALSLSIMACEDLSISKVINRTIRFVAGNFKRAIAFALLLLIIQTILGWILYLPVLALVFFDMFREGISNPLVSQAGYDVPFYLKVIEQATESLSALISGPLHFFAFGLFYADLRARKEGIDIASRLNVLEDKLITA